MTKIPTLFMHDPDKNDAHFDTVEEEVVAVDLTVTANKNLDSEELNVLDKELARVNSELERYTNRATKADYSFSVASGLLTGLVDSFFVGEFSLKSAAEWGEEKTEAFVLKVAKSQKFTGDNYKDAILYLAEEKKHSNSRAKRGFHIAADTNTNDFGGGNHHHLRDFAHHGTITGLAFSILTQFTEKSYGTDVHGNFIVVEVRDKQFIGSTFAQKLEFGIVYWFFHLVSDMAGSGGDSEGTGIPGPILSLAKMIAATPLFKNAVNENGHRELSVFVSKLFNGTFFGERDENGRLIPLRFDLRTELGVYKAIGEQTIPVLINEAMVRSYYFFNRLYNELMTKAVSSFDKVENIDWNVTKPYGNRTIDRMIAIAAMTFNVVDTTDAALRAAVESGGNWVIFSGKFVARYNYVGAGRAAVAVFREFSNEKKEEQLVHEKMILTEAKTEIALVQLYEFKEMLNDKLANYLAEDIEAFLEGFDYMSEGFTTGDSDLVIKGNVIIQRILGREPQFTNQEEFDALMESDVPLQL